MTMNFERVSLGDLLRLERRPIKIQPSESYQEIGIYCFGRGIFHKLPRPGYEVGEKDLFQLRKGDFILQVTFAWEGAVAVVTEAEEGMYGSTRFPTFRVDVTRCDPQFLLNYFRTDEGIQQLIKISPGSAGRNRVLSIKRIPEVRVPLPPLEEQRRIVARIEQLATKINEARSLRRQAAEEVQTLATFRIGTFIPVGTTLLPLQELCLQVTDGEHATPMRTPVRDVPLVTAKNVRDGHLDLRVTDFVSRETAEKCWKRCRPQTDDVLMICVGATIGRVCRLVASPEMVIVRSVALLRPDPAKLESRYLEYALESFETQSQIWSSVKQAAQPCLYLNRMGALLIPVPSLVEQQRIVAELDALKAETDQLKSLQSETSAELDALLPSVLSKAFAGEL